MCLFESVWRLVAQCLEHTTEAREVAGSNPTGVASIHRQVHLPPHGLCVSEETLKAVGPFYPVSMPGEVKDPTGPKNVSCHGLRILEKDNSEINHSCVSLRVDCLEYMYI